MRWVGECALVERLDPELSKFEPKGEGQMAKTRESICKGIANYNSLNRSSQIINYNIEIKFSLKH